MSIQQASGVLLTLGVFVLTPLPAAAGQVPIHGLTGTIALPENVEKFYSGVNKLTVRTSDGVDQLVHGRTRAKVHGDAPASLDSFQPGTPVLVHYTVNGIQASGGEAQRLADSSSVNDAIVTKVDRSEKRIAVRFADGTTENLRLTHSAGHSASRSRVVVYHSDAGGRTIAHYFKPRAR